MKNYLDADGTVKRDYKIPAGKLEVIEAKKIDNCREAFEINTLKRAEKDCPELKKDWLKKKPNGAYFDNDVSAAWHGWQDCWKYKDNQGK